jgi:ubiquinone biosynthesis protein
LLVAVKIQRPDIDKIIEADLEIMLHLATLAEKYLKEAEAMGIVKLVEKFARVIRKELNFRIEAAYIERFANNFQDDTTIHVPKVYNGFSSGA